MRFYRFDAKGAATNTGGSAKRAPPLIFLHMQTIFASLSGLFSVLQWLMG
ncbi:hypothetical protein [Agrobacterium rosae]|uniref:Uncharacterized protein n=1 Tax=Agrobacterium rosae TaxID=1972867 RepID=A0ABU4VXK3_9HYPH|nr:hypothetical protein [Agrobacterium rosae]MDX8330249.1 hypothetical protein [Agrobacterium rosae]